MPTEENNNDIVEKAKLSKSIKDMFVYSGFTFLSIGDKHKSFGNRVGEFDQAFLFQNIILICEETIITKRERLKDHLLNKQEAAKQFIQKKADVINWLKADFPNDFEKYDTYNDCDRYELFFLYFTRPGADISSLIGGDRFDPFIFVPDRTLKYFLHISSCIKKSARFEIFKFLGLSGSKIGPTQSANDIKMIPITIISPADNTGDTDGIRMVSFMANADLLIENSYVLRNDNWEESTSLYQRLIDKKKLDSVRSFLAKNRQTFYNNIIVGLPKEVEFREKNSNKIVSVSNISDFGNYIMYFPNKFNSICIIDGQHRVYAHYEGNDKYEEIISDLRKRLHLLVTGLIFPPEMSEADIRKHQSKIFLDINDNSKPIPKDLLQKIYMISDPLSEVAIARRVIVELNQMAPFEGLFELSELDAGKIKTSTIIGYALKSLVILDIENKKSLYHYWDMDRQRKLDRKEEDITNYISYAAKSLQVYFNALYNLNKDSWNDKNSKILSVTSINGFIMAYQDSLPVYGVRNYDFYQERLSKLSMKFQEGEFSFTSSGYRKFASEIFRDIF